MYLSSPYKLTVLTEYTQEKRLKMRKHDLSFELEYNLKYLGKFGNVFHSSDIEAATCTSPEAREMLDWSTSTMLGISMGIEVTQGTHRSSPLLLPNIETTRLEGSMPEKTQMNYIINHIMQLKQRHHIMWMVRTQRS